MAAGRIRPKPHRLEDAVSLALKSPSQPALVMAIEQSQEPRPNKTAIKAQSPAHGTDHGHAQARARQGLARLYRGPCQGNKQMRRSQEQGEQAGEEQIVRKFAQD